MIVLVVVGVFVFVVAATEAVVTELSRRNDKRATLRLLAAYGDTAEAGVNRLDPFAARTIAPAIAWASRLGHRVSPAGSVERTEAKLRIAGYSKPGALDRFLAARIGVVILALPVMLVLGSQLQLKGLAAVMVVGLVLVSAVLGPDAALARQADARQLAIRAALPEFLDLLTISVEAGLGFDQALDRISFQTTGPLAEEFQRLRGETRAGVSRAVALRSLADRVDVAELRTFVLAVQQAAAFGISIGVVLRGQAEDMRIKWRQIAQEKAIKAPVKMLVPTVFCVFPSLFVVTVGPAIVNLMHGAL